VTCHSLVADPEEGSVLLRPNCHWIQSTFRSLHKRSEVLTLRFFPSSIRSGPEREHILPRFPLASSGLYLLLHSLYWPWKGHCLTQLSVDTYGTLPPLILPALYLCPLPNPNHFTLKMEAAWSSETLCSITSSYGVTSQKTVAYIHSCPVYFSVFEKGIYHIKSTEIGSVIQKQSTHNILTNNRLVNRLW
jgi:hypothetical protein